MEYKQNKILALDFSDTKYSVKSCRTDDDVNNDSDTSSTFSLQECMNEFRSRRVRRLALTQHRQNTDKKGFNNQTSVEQMTEIDLIKQNLCNKEQERNCKPCKNGFCYCFTSDSGDGGNLEDGQSFGKMLTSNSRRNNRPRRLWISNTCKKTSKSLPSKDHIWYGSPAVTASYLKSARKAKSRLRAISSLETSMKNEPLIRITQELRDTCVISNVKVNKYKIKTFGKSTNFQRSAHEISQRGTHVIDQTEANEHSTNHIYHPTAPLFEEILNLETDHLLLQGNDQKYNLFQSRRSTVGKLLQKRLSTSKSSIKPRYSEKASQKLQTTDLFLEDKLYKSSTSTPSSIHKAKRFADDFLPEVNNMDANIKLTTEEMHSNTSRNFSSPERKSQPLISRKTSLNNVINNMKLKYLPRYDQKVKPESNNETQVIRELWNKAEVENITDYDVHTKENDIISSRPQQIPNIGIVRNEKAIGWQIPSSLDNVDGNVHYNLASHLEDKKTAIEKKLISPSQNSKEGPEKKKLLWTEQLRQLSPWSKNCNTSEVNNSTHKLRSGSKAFIISSKNKFIHLISPKKDNKDIHSCKIKKVLFRNTAVQTSPIDDASRNQKSIPSLYYHGSSPQSPPGSYYSPLKSPCFQYQLLMQSENNNSNGNKTGLNSSTNVELLPKKESSSGNRRISLCLYCTYPFKEGSPKNIDTTNSSECCNHKTYRSFNTELDQDVSISKVNYVLSKIRAKLETNDQEVSQTFLESETLHNTKGFDYVANCSEKRINDCVELQKYSQLSKRSEKFFHDPIYSEIGDDSVISSATTEFDAHNRSNHFYVGDNRGAFYTKVNKLHKEKTEMRKQKTQVPLAQIINDSLQSKKVITNFIPLPALPEPTDSEGTSYYLPLSSTLPLSQSQSLSNIRVTEQNSKMYQNFSKSNLSLHRSEIFLENLCKGELLVGSDFRRNIYEKHEKKDQICGSGRNEQSIIQPSGSNTFGMLSASDLENACNNSVCYELANDGIDLKNAVGSNMGLSTILPPSYNNQSTPKKQNFVIEEETIANLDEEMEKINDHLYNSCPNTPYKKEYVVGQRNSSPCFSMNQVSVSTRKLNETKSKILNAVQGYNSLKNVLHNSFRKSKIFIKEKGKHLPNSWSFSISNAKISNSKNSMGHSTPDLENLLSFNESASISDQIAKTVNICRTLPDMETSMEMVEAERLLLFSALRRRNQQASSATAKKNNICHKSEMRFFIDDIFLPVNFHVNQDIYFNNFYIITFECGGIVKSTQSSECVDGAAVFLDNGIEFIYSSELKMNTVEGRGQKAIQCTIFLLRLRKISKIGIQPEKRAIIQDLTQNSSATLKSSSSVSSASSSAFSEVVSRFRLHASFTLDAKDFSPYEYVHQESINSDRICIRASCFCNLPLTTRTTSTSLLGQIRLKGRAEVRMPKHTFKGFLNVQDPRKQHNWNRRWCTLDGIFLHIWQDESILSSLPVLSIDLRDSIYKNNLPLTCSPIELCARPRSFRLECKLNKSSEDKCKSSVLFSADTQNDLDDWLKNLNIALDFIVIWF